MGTSNLRTLLYLQLHIVVLNCFKSGTLTIHNHFQLYNEKGFERFGPNF